MVHADKRVSLFLGQLSALLVKGTPFFFWEKLFEAKQLCSKIKPKNLGKIEKGVVIEGNVFLSKGAVIKSGSRIEGNVFAGENTVIGPNAFLRGFVVLGKDCFVGMSEVKNSVFLDGARAPHFNYVGDSILGENVNLGAGTKIANLRHDNKNIFVEIGGKKIDSGQRKLGALVGNNTKTGVNSSINCGTIVPNNSKILPNGFFR